ncbi:hypothetical protein SFUMM280S_00303 [Streptomyces fumanus]
MTSDSTGTVEAVPGDQELRRLLAGLTAVRDGDFGTRLPDDADGLLGDIAKVFNGMAATSWCVFTSEVTRAAREVGNRRPARRAGEGAGGLGHLVRPDRLRQRHGGQPDHTGPGHLPRWPPRSPGCNLTRRCRHRQAASAVAEGDARDPLHQHQRALRGPGPPRRPASDQPGGSPPVGSARGPADRAGAAGPPSTAPLPRRGRRGRTRRLVGLRPRRAGRSASVRPHPGRAGRAQPPHHHGGRRCRRTTSPSPRASAMWCRPPWCCCPSWSRARSSASSSWPRSARSPRSTGTS